MNPKISVCLVSKNYSEFNFRISLRVAGPVIIYISVFTLPVCMGHFRLKYSSYNLFIFQPVFYF